MYLCSFFLCLIQMYESSCCLFFVPTKNINKTLFNKCNHILLFSLVHLLFILPTFSDTLYSFSFSSFIVSEMLLNLVSLSSWLFFYFIFSRDASSLVHRVFVILQRSFFFRFYYLFHLFMKFCIQTKHSVKTKKPGGR